MNYIFGFLASLSFLAVVGAAAGETVVSSQLERAFEAQARGEHPEGIVAFETDDSMQYRVYVVLESAAKHHAGFEDNTSRRMRADHAVANMQRRLPNGIAERVMRSYEGLPILSMTLDQRMIGELATIKGVKRIEPWPVYEPLWFESQALIGMDVLQSMSMTGDGAAIGIIDTSIDSLHPALGGVAYDPDPALNTNDKIVGGWDFSAGGMGDNDPTLTQTTCTDSPPPHGNLVASFAAGADVLVEGQQFRGAAPDADIVFLKLYDEMTCSPNIEGDMIAAVNWLRVNRMTDEYELNVVVTSIGVDGVFIFDDVGECEQAFLSANLAFEEATAAGLIFFAAAGNWGNNSKEKIAAPACFSSVISVGMVFDDTYNATLPGACPQYLAGAGVTMAEADDVVRRSSSADFLDLVAPGAFVTTAGTDFNLDAEPPLPIDRGLATCVSGTSVAAPIAAAVAAVLAHEAGFDNLNKNSMLALLRHTGVPAFDEYANNRETPRVDALAALNQLNSDADLDMIANSTDNCTFVPNPAQLNTNFDDDDDDDYGNYCDPDLNNDNKVNAIDLAMFRNSFFTNDPDADFNGDGVVNAQDLSILRSFFFKAPGPSWIDLDF